jgi:hypothetical protein
MREPPLSRAVRRRDDSQLKRKDVLLHPIGIYRFNQDICLERNHGYANMNSWEAEYTILKDLA